MPGTHGYGCGCREEEVAANVKFLLPWIDVEGVRGLNEEADGTARRVFRTYDTRLNDDLFVESTEGDAELIIHVPFTAPVKLAAVAIIGGDMGTAPLSVRLHVNREDLDFQSAQDLQPIQQVDLVEDFHGAVQFPLRAAKLSNVTHLAMHFPASFGGEQTRIHWIGLWGVGSDYKREAVVTCYESRANIADHRQPDDVSPGANVS